jgi:hypothetical protein
MNKKPIVSPTESMARVIILIVIPALLGIAIPLYCRFTDAWSLSTSVFLLPITLLWSMWFGFFVNARIPGVKSSDAGSPLGFWMIFGVVVTVVDLVLFGLFKLLF